MPLLIALLAGASSVFAYAPFELAWVMPIAWGALYWLVRRTAKVRTAFGLGFAWGFGAFAAGIGWLYVALNRYGGMAPPLAVLAVALLCAYLALYPALSAALQRYLRPAQGWLEPLCAATCWTLGEWLRGNLLTGFPWLAIGYTQTPPSPLAGWAPVLGVYGLGFLLALLAALLVQIFERKIHRLGAFVVVVSIIAVGAGLRFVAWTTPIGKPLQVALLQTNIPQDAKWQRERLMEWLTLSYDMVRAQAAPLVVLPETTLPLLESQLPAGYLEALEAAARAHGGDVILGVFTQDQAGIYNSAISRGIAPQQHYSKNHLVPFGEYSPPSFDWFYRWVNIPMADQTKGGAKQPLLQIAGQKIAVNICYEDVFGEELLYALPEASLMLNLSNLAWYGDFYAQPQHLQISRMRAMETGRPMLRATNTGMTAVVQPDGNVSGVLPAFTTGALNAEVQGYAGLTPYARTGNWPVLLIVMAILATAAAQRRRA